VPFQILVRELGPNPLFLSIVTKDEQTDFYWTRPPLLNLPQYTLESCTV
jgi:hypothetical protein